MESYLPSNSPDKAPQGFYPLHVARYCSQVCQSWRQTMVGSSQVWADLIDLDQIKHQDNDHWMDLVMQRTGRALLSVVGHRGVGSHRASQRFFTFLLTEEWPRVVSGKHRPHISKNLSGTAGTIPSNTSLRLPLCQLCAGITSLLLLRYRI